MEIVNPFLLLNIGTRTERALVFLDIWSVINDNDSIKTKVYGKEAHTDTSDDGQETGRDTTISRKPTSKISSVVLTYIKGV